MEYWQAFRKGFIEGWVMMLPVIKVALIAVGIIAFLLLASIESVVVTHFVKKYW